MKAIAKTLAAALVGMAMAGAPILAQTVTIDYDHTVNFLKFKTYTWEKIHASDPDVESRITLAMQRDMTGRYMTEVAKGGDVTLTAVEATQNKWRPAIVKRSRQRTGGAHNLLSSCHPHPPGWAAAA